MKVQISKPEVWVDRTLQTASWWDEYVLLPGQYEVEWQSINYRPVPDQDAAYWATIRVDAIRTREYRVNRLLTASSSHLTVVNERCVKSFTVYAYQIKPEGRVPFPGDSTAWMPEEAA